MNDASSAGDDDRRPVEDILVGMSLHPLEPGWTPIEAFVLIKSLDEDGAASWSYRTTHPLNREELLGVLTIHTALLKRELLGEWDDQTE